MFLLNPRCILYMDERDIDIDRERERERHRYRQRKTVGGRIRE